MQYLAAIFYPLHMPVAMWHTPFRKTSNVTLPTEISLKMSIRQSVISWFPHGLENGETFSSQGILPKIMENGGILPKILEKWGKFVSPKMWEPWIWVLQWCLWIIMIMYCVPAHRWSGTQGEVSAQTTYNSWCGGGWGSHTKPQVWFDTVRSVK